jgi:hypothetical protein
VPKLETGVPCALEDKLKCPSNTTSRKAAFIFESMDISLTEG